MIKDAFKTIRHNKIWTCIIVMLSLVSFTISLNTFTNAMSLYTQIDMVKEVFEDNYFDSLYTLRIDNLDGNEATTIFNAEQYISSLKNTKFGAFYETGEYFNELTTNQLYLNKNMDIYKGTYREKSLGISEVIYIDGEMLDFINNKITTQMLFDKTSKYLPIYVGSSYKDILSVGEILTMSRTSQKYIVKGYLEDEMWLNNDDFISFAPVSLNSKFMIPFSELDKNDNISQLSVNGKIFVGFNSNKVEQNINKINSYAISNNLKININSLNTSIENYKRDNEKIIKNNIFLSIMVGICSLTSIISAISIEVLLRKKEYGIKIAFGLTKKKLIHSLISEVIIMELFAAIITFTFVYLKTSMDQSIFNEVYLRTLVSSSIFYLIIMLIMVCIIVLILPLFIINHYVPSELIKGGE